MLFKDRFEAGERLAKELVKYKNSKDAIILAIPRGGLEIGNVLAKELNIALDIIIVKKIPYPGQEEYAIGAVGVNESIVNEDVVRSENIPKSYVDGQIKELTKAIKERYENYRGKKPLPNLKGKIVILTDDGIATGYTMLAAVDIIRRQNPAEIILAVPVAPPESLDKFVGKADKIICLEKPEMFFAIGQFYENFTQVENGEAIKLLEEANK
ncbi:phosphoribosyltransferase [Candidatus Woesearchaeota archaeon]|nr:phosphoribosyltransferase [Candidatus Woesearchaeota archaeon]